MADAVRTDPRGAYSDAAHDVLEAFAANGTADAPFALPEFGDGAVFPGAMAMGFHFVDYVVHGWDVAESLGVPYELPSTVVDAVLPLVLAVPDGDIRTTAGSPFAPALESVDGDDFERILRHLGRNPAWAQRYSTDPSRRRTLIDLVAVAAVQQLPGHSEQLADLAPRVTEGPGGPNGIRVAHLGGGRGLGVPRRSALAGMNRWTRFAGGSPRSCRR